MHGFLTCIRVAKRNRCFVGADMELCAEQVAASAASRSSGRLSMPTFSLQPPPAFDRRSSMEDFAGFFYLPIKRHQEIMDLTFSLHPAVEKAVCVRTSSKGYPPSLNLTVMMLSGGRDP
ncbi:hypothetical protein CesoFtcFv8_025492 [Champsocephalus esox]|uniref:Uncharacterized protein n=1 Tax=Champsocephalus esox TaxID=159716 RepID=A0AAN8GF46_9TELE|nr:hypothetical protein CesoFtcFv8_025492 [Champsocephalus esox]